MSDRRSPLAAWLLRHPGATLALMTLAFLVSGALSVDLVRLLHANLGFLAEHGWQAARDDGPFPSATMRLSGFLDGEWQRPAYEIEEIYLGMLQEGRYRDAAAGRTLDGPHRADLLIRHREKDMEAERCSTGEQKALLVGLILAHAGLVAGMTGHAPVLLLDEIAAHLDEGRRAALFDRVDALGGQAFMTGTDRSMFDALGERAQFLTVSHGGIVP